MIFRHTAGARTYLLNEWMIGSIGGSQMPEAAGEGFPEEEALELGHER